ncbi:Dolichol kinase [Gryllus bimaculatus]|nr:Dolichol kinase [Gryllus bimaculatus]
MNNILRILEEKTRSILATCNVKPRPHAGPGVWLIFLLPGIMIVNCFKYSHVSEIFNLASDLSSGLFIASVVIVLAIYSSNPKENHNFNSGMIFPFVFTSCRLYFVHDRGLAFSMGCGVLTSYTFSSGLMFSMKSFPFCFTFGEATILTQAVILFLFSSTENIRNTYYKAPEQDTEIATLILQVGLLGVFAICATLYFIPASRSAGPFYGVVFGILFLIVIPSLHFLLGRSPVLWIIFLIWNDNLKTVWLVGYWMLCVCAATIAVAYQIQKGQQASTSVRKYFHILAVAVYFPGLVTACCLLYLATAVVLALFVVLELVRLLNIPPLGNSLQEGFAVYADEKDAGNLALTPIYLLTGCSLPLWLHPVACSSPSTIISLSSGLLSVGVGDTLASSIGSRFGRHKWPGSNKSIEGTIACVVGQMLAIIVLYLSGVIQLSSWVSVTIPVSVILTSVIEAKTDQVDNLVLPLVNFLVI